MTDVNVTTVAIRDEDPEEITALQVPTFFDQSHHYLQIAIHHAVNFFLKFLDK